MPRNNSVIGSIVGLLVFVGIGAFFLLGITPFRFLNFFPLLPVIFVIGIMGIAAATSVRRSNYCESKPYNQNQYYTREAPRSNPYVVKTPSSSTVRPIYIEDSEPEKPIGNYCQYCGTKKDRNATFCHNCGTKLQ